MTKSDDLPIQTPRDEGIDLDLPAWLEASLDDVTGFDFEAPICLSQQADPYDLSELFRIEAQKVKSAPHAGREAAVRVWTMLASVLAMSFNPDTRHEPFGPRLVFADGRRTANLDDFKSRVSLLANLADRATNPIIRARLFDICWMLERKRKEAAIGAFNAYLAIVQSTISSDLQYSFDPEVGALCHETRGLLRRAMQIGRMSKLAQSEILPACSLIVSLTNKAIMENAYGPIYGFAELHLEFEITDPALVGTSLRSVLEKSTTPINLHMATEIWKLAARAFHIAKNEKDKNECLVKVAEELVAQSEQTGASAMLEAHFLSEAVAQLHGLPNVKQRRAQLKKRLLEVQARVPEEMTVSSQVLDLEDIAGYARDRLAGADLFDRLFIFSDLERSPSIEQLEHDAIKSIQDFPLSSMFGASHMDFEGKVTSRTQSSSVGGDGEKSAIFNKIARAEDVRRTLVAFGKIEAARHEIMHSGYLSQDNLAALIGHSPFIPRHLEATYARGFIRFFQGDFVSSTYILTPLLESSLRHVLKDHGFDVSTFDAASQTQEDRSISSLFDHMRNELDSIFSTAMTHDIDRVFLRKPGPAIRHVVAHGLMQDGDPYSASAIYGCWLIFRLCMLPLLPHNKELRSILGPAFLLE